MALSISLLGAGLFSTTTGPYTIPAAVTPAASSGIVVCAVADNSTEPTIDTPTWLDGAWTKELSLDHTTQAQWLIVWSGKAVSSPGSDDLTVTATSSLGCNLVVVQITGQDTTDFVLQPESLEQANATSISITLNNALAGSDSACLGFFQHGANEAHTPSGSETELVDNGHNNPARRISAQYIVNNQTNGCSWTTSIFSVGGIMEIKAAAGAAAEDPFPYVGGGYYPTEG